MLCEIHEDLLPDLLYLLSPRDIMNLSLSCKYLYKSTKVYNKIYERKYAKLLSHLDGFELNFLVKANQYLTFQIVEQLVFKNRNTKFTISSGNGQDFEFTASYSSNFNNEADGFTYEQRKAFQSFYSMKMFLSNLVLNHSTTSKSILLCSDVKNYSIFISDV